MLSHDSIEYPLEIPDAERYSTLLPKFAPSEKQQQQRQRFLESFVQEGRRQRLTVRAPGCCQISA